MKAPENLSASPYAESEASTTGDWLRLTIMLLLLILGRAVAPLPHALKPLTKAAPRQAPMQPSTFFLVSASQ